MINCYLIFDLNLSDIHFFRLTFLLIDKLIECEKQNN
jgi:hypothetical protein